MELALGAMASLAPKLSELLMVEDAVHKGLKPDILSLFRELVMFNATLVNASRVPSEQLSEVEKLWAWHVREVSYDLEDAVDNIILRVAGGKFAAAAQDTNVFKKILGKATAAMKKVKERHLISDKVKDIKKLCNELADLWAKYTVMDVGSNHAMSVGIDPRVLNIYKKESDLVGVEESRDGVIRMLRMKDDAHVSDQSLKIVSIVGMGGLGKTTLAKTVYDMFKKQFGSCAFISVGRTPNLIRTLEMMLVELDQKYSQVDMASWDVERFSKELHKFLEHKRYFIVIDDLWDTSSWKYIAGAFVQNNNGSRIIVTTRDFEVATEVGEIYRMKPLSYTDSQKLFYMRIFGGDKDCPDKDGLAEASDKIMKKCGGVPLAIITMASLLADKPIKDWLNSIGFVHAESRGFDNTMRILSWSYYDLPYYLRPCLLYLSIYPEDHVIEKNMLIWRWIAEGFVYGEATVELFELGESYFNELINRSLMQPVEIKGTGLIYGCQVDYLVLQLIRSLSCEENFVSILKDEEGDKFSSSKFRRLAILNIKEEHSLVDNTDLAKLRSLNAIGCPIYMIPSVSSFHLLRVLDLESCGSMEGYDIKYLGKLLLLRFIGLRNTFVRTLPKELGHLKMLQTLELEGSGVENLPASIGGLRSLMCLSADWTTRVAGWIGKLTSLQQLVMYPGGGIDEHWLGNLMELRELRCLIKADDEKQLSDLLKSVLKLPKIEVLHFDYYGALLNSSVEMEPSGFACCEHIRSLELQLLKFSRLPAWINAQNFPKLCHLSLILFDVDEQDLENLGRFTELSHLQLLTVNTEHRDAITFANGAFQNLKFCSITKPFKFRQGDMPSLLVLDFHLNVRLQTGGDSDLDFDFGLGNLPSLQQVVVQINCLDAFSAKVKKAEVVLQETINNHPNRPIVDISLSRQKLEKADNDKANNISYPDKGKGVLVAEGDSKSAYYSKSSSLARDGIDEPMNELVKMLSVVDNETYNKKMKIVPIVRSEGRKVKTTLAQKVFDKLRLQYDCAAFVLVGQNPDMRKVLIDILIGLDKQKYKDFPMTILDIMELIGLVRKSLINRRFFVVVDDIWDFKAWDLIKCALIENRNGSAVLKTASRQNWDHLNSRSSGDDEFHFDAHKQSDPGSTTHLKGFFYENLFGSEDKCPDALKNICEELIEICDGILSVVDETVGLLADVPKTLKDWQPVYQRRKFDLSYPKLPDHLKNCLKYFSMFPKGYEISAERLVWAWIAQGFIKETQGRQDLQKQEAGKSYLSDLINRKMIEAVEVDADGMALSCRAYDLLHGLILSISTEEKFVEILNGSHERALLPDTKVHRLSIQIQRNNIVHSPPKAWLNQVQSLVVSCDAVPSLSDFQGLHAMDLGGCDSLQVGHLKGIRKTTSLTYLAIGGKYISAIPKEVSWLKNLRTLDLTASGLSELPRCVLSLTALERLFVNGHMKIPGKIAKMSGLQELGDINIVKPELLKKLRKLSKLRVLRIAMWSWDEGSKTSVKLWWETLHSLVGSCKNIESLSILTFCSLDFMDGSDDNKWTPQTLRKLEIRHSSFHDKLPSWFNSLSNISSLTIEVNKLSQNITDTLGKLSTLSSLSLTSKQVPEREVHFVIDSADRFKKLESLKFVSDEMVKLLERPESNAKQQFTRLTIVFQASRTAQSRNKDFRFGLDKLLSLQHVRVEINCSNARQQMVNDAEAAIGEEISKIYRDDGSKPNLEIRRLQEESMIAEEDQTTGPQDAKTSSSSTMEAMRAQPIGQSLIPSVEIVSKVLSQNSSNDTFFKNVGILTSSTKIKTLKERVLQELNAEKQGSTALHQEVDELKKKSKVTELALAKTQWEFEEYKKQQEENNLLLKRILHSNNNAGNS